MVFTMKRRTAAPSPNDKAVHNASPTSTLLPGSPFSTPGSPRRDFVSKRCARRTALLIGILAILLLISMGMLLMSNIPPLADPSPDALRLRRFSVNRSLVGEPLATANKAAIISLIIPVVSEVAGGEGSAPLLSALLHPLLLQEAALCHRTQDGHSLSIHVHPVVVTRLPGTAVRDALRPVLEKRGDVSGEPVPNDLDQSGGFLTDGAAWRTWRLSTAALRKRFDLPAPASAVDLCFEDTITLVMTYDKGVNSATAGVQPRDRLEILVDAGLRTRAGQAGSYFVVLPSFMAASRMDYTVPGDAEEVRRPGTGLIESLVRTVRSHNEGKVAAAQCTMLQLTPGTTLPRDTSTSAYPPEALTLRHLRSLSVIDKGILLLNTHVIRYVAPFAARRLHGHLAVDQRASWEEPVDAVSLHCGIFHRMLYNAIGGLAATRSEPSVLSALSSQPPPNAKRGLRAVGAPDRGGWLLSLRMQTYFSEWQVWSSRGVGVLRDDLTGVQDLPSVSGMQHVVHSLLDTYGMAMYDTIVRLQRSRIGVPRLQRGLPSNTSRAWVDSPLFPSVVQYYTDFTEGCCGLNREAMGYIRPMVERYSVRVMGTREVCAKPGDGVLGPAYARLDSEIMWPAPPSVTRFFRERLRERARINFQHWRGFRHRWSLSGLRARGTVVSIGRSLSELSNIQSNWVKPMRERTDEIWATSDFFAAIYRRNGIDAKKIRIVPEAVDVYDYDPANYERQPMLTSTEQEGNFDNMPNLTEEQRITRYVFYANFKWEDRKGWDVLLGAYWDAFGPSAPPELQNRTTLVIKTKFEATFTRGVSATNFVESVERWGRLGWLKGMQSLADFPHTIVISAPISSGAITQMYANADAFIFPSKAEGWGLPATEAMSMGLPVLVTEWGGLRRFITPDTAFRIPVDALEEIEPDSPYGYSEGMKMALPSREKVAELMRYVMQHPDHARRVGKRARALMIREMSEEAVGDAMDGYFTQAVLRKIKSPTNTTSTASSSSK